MRGWHVHKPGPIDSGPLRLVDIPTPTPARDELLVRVRVCAVCRTDLHVAEGDLPIHKPDVVPGHQIVGTVADVGSEVEGYLIGERVGIAWLRHTDGTCRYCSLGRENLCPESRYTGWDADGGYAEYATVPADFAYRLPDGYDDAEVAPLLCAGIIGYRALLRADLPRVGRRRLRRSDGAARRGDPVRAGRRPGAGRARRARPRRNPRHIRHPPHRRAGAQLRAAPVLRAQPAQRNRQHPPGWTRFPGFRGRAPAAGDRHPLPPRSRRPGAGRSRARPVQRRRGAHSVSRGAAPVSCSTGVPPRSTRAPGTPGLDTVVAVE